MTETQRPTLYIVAARDESAYTGDIAGALYTADGELLWSHVSSTTGWLRRDLTTGFTDRKYALEQRYPDGYDVVWNGPSDPVPWEPDRGPVETPHRRHLLTDAEVQAAPLRSVLRVADGSIVARFDERYGVVFGDDRPFPWTVCRAPAIVLWLDEDPTTPPAAPSQPTDTRST
jgi:hypothetical protein